MTKAEDLRALFNKDSVIRIAGAHDGITAKLVELNGFDGVWRVDLRYQPRMPFLMQIY